MPPLPSDTVYVNVVVPEKLGAGVKLTSDTVTALTVVFGLPLLALPPAAMHRYLRGWARLVLWLLPWLMQAKPQLGISSSKTFFFHN